MRRSTCWRGGLWRAATCATPKLLEHLKQYLVNQSEQPSVEHVSAEQATNPGK